MSYDNLGEMQHLWSKEPSQQPSTFLGTSFSRQRQSWESVLLKGQKWLVYQGELPTILGPNCILVKHRTSLWEFKCEICGNWIRIKRKITKHMICKHCVTFTSQATLHGDEVIRIGHADQFRHQCPAVCCRPRGARDNRKKAFWKHFPEERTKHVNYMLVFIITDTKRCCWLRQG